MWRRFISPDDSEYLDPESINGLNLYCYCNNDPINFVDPSGHFALLAAILIGTVLGGIYGGVSAAANGQNILGGILIGAVVGGLTGLITEVATIPWMLAGTFLVGAAGDVASQKFLDGKDWENVNLISAVWAGVANAGLAVVGKGLSNIDTKVGLQGLEKTLFGTITNSPLMGMGMALNMIISQYSTEYTVGDCGEDITEGLYARIWRRKRYGY